MEPNMLRYFLLIANTVSVIIIWMLANLFFGLYLGYGYFYEGSKTVSAIYYAISVVSLIFLVRYIIKKWNRFAEK